MAVRNLLSRFPDPETGRSIVQMEQVHKLELSGNTLHITLGLTSWAGPVKEAVCDDLLKHIESAFPDVEVELTVVDHHRPAEPSGTLGLCAKTVFAVGAGKGGVGKSSVAAYLACGLARAGAKVGLMDADVYGPSVPHMFGATDTPRLLDKRIQPLEQLGIKLLSMGMLVPPGDAVVWRGPMLHSALTQFVRDTAWGDLDYLIVDMPPGTGDVAISLSQLLSVTGAIVVCTPQDVALLDAVKAISMFGHVKIPVLGMVENMSFFICPNCTARHDIFGTGGAKRRAAEMNVPFLGEIPLITELRVLADQGRIDASFDYEAARPYLEGICKTLVGNIVEQRKKQPVMPKLPLL
jgi:ATP-binding protein involved in chromosome partitioning